MKEYDVHQKLPPLHAVSECWLKTRALVTSGRGFVVRKPNASCSGTIRGVHVVRGLLRGGRCCYQIVLLDPVLTVRARY